MTTIAFKDGILAADSRSTIETEAGGCTKHTCAKLFRRTIKIGKRKPYDVVIATAGEVGPALVYVDWYAISAGLGEPPRVLLDHDSDFTCLILTPHGLYEVDKFCRPDLIIEPFYAIGSGRKEALAVMHHDGTAVEAVRIAAKIDPFTGGRVVTESLISRRATHVRKKSRR